VRNLELNGRVPDLAETQRILTAGYGHYTSMQVRDRSVRGLALHFARLADGNDEFFGWSMGVGEEHRLRELIRHALGDAADASVRVGFVPGSSPDAPPEVLVSVSDPISDEPRPPLRVRTDPYRRDWPEHKHAATMGLSYAVRLARLAGYDDALFVGERNLVTEGTSWNIALFDGDQVIWPQAPMLKGVTMVLLQIAMSMQGIPWTLREVDAAELPLLAGAAAVNSIWPAQPIAGVDGVLFDADDKLIPLLRQAWDSVPFDVL
jgi:branched-subunit amino acid aminotransferase/4-amino-4-deoxychorismate lyase